jgi:hypothetical protein
MVTKSESLKPKKEALADPTRPKLPPGKETTSDQEEADLEEHNESEHENENTSKS